MFSQRQQSTVCEMRRFEWSVKKIDDPFTFAEMTYYTCTVADSVGLWVQKLRSRVTFRDDRIFYTCYSHRRILGAIFFLNRFTPSTP